MWQNHFSVIVYRSVFDFNFPAEESSAVDVDDDGMTDAAEFKNIPNSLVDIPSKFFPLVITFRKFLMMLDGSVGVPTSRDFLI